jgi:hypothetical protein
LGISAAPVFAILSDDTAKQLQLRPVPQAPVRLLGKPSPVVIQAVWPEDTIVLSKSAYRLSSSKAAPSKTCGGSNTESAPAQAAVFRLIPVLLAVAADDVAPLCW